VRRAEPLPDASHVELVLASFAAQLRQAVVDCMNHRVADVTVFSAVNLLFDVLLPE